MFPKIFPRLRAALGAALLLVMYPAASHAQNPDTVVMSHDPARYGIVVSATRTPQKILDLPNAAVVVRGSDLRRTGARTLADALIDVVGLETGGGTDNGSRLPNIGMWGLKEFDALLITVDGVPVGGPFNPSLAQISVEDIERIEIVKGPQGSMYGISAFAGMVQVFTRTESRDGYTASAGGGSFGAFDGRIAAHRAFTMWTLDATAAGGRGGGWQDRTSNQVARGRLGLSRAIGTARVAFDLGGLSDRQDWGSPVPVDAGLPLAGFEMPEMNSAVGGATVEHAVLSIGSHVSKPVCASTVVRNTLGFTRDSQKSVRSFVGAIAGDTVTSAGVELEPVESSFYEDLSFVTRFAAGGPHELVTGAAVTQGRTNASGIGFDFDQVLGDASSIPNWSEVPVGDHRSFDDHRLFFGLYAHDSWTPARALTLSGGGRWDRARETLHAFGQEAGFPAATSDDEKTDAAWSGDLGAVVRLLPEGGSGALGTLNVYGNWKSSFKPAAPNLTEAEDAHILDPEHTHSIEGGIKGTAFAGQLAFEASAFQLDFHNMVVGFLNASSAPELMNAGHERFKGFEASVSIAPAAVPGLTLSAGRAHHDPRFVQFTFVTPGGTFRNVSGKLVELAPQELWNARASYAPAKWLGGWVAARHQGARPLTRRNSFWTAGFEEVDAGLTFKAERATVSLAGRNLGDSRHYVSESDIGDSQFYVAPPKRFSGQVAFSF
jgi:iron complex outermembrane receptor protein